MIDTFKVIVSAVIINDSSQVLLGKRSDDEEVFPGLWGIPGGKVEASASQKNILEETLVREAKEEMGILIKPIRVLETDCKINENNKGKIYVIYLAELVSGEPKPLEDTTEVKWWDIADLKEEMLTPGTLDNILMASP